MSTHVMCDSIDYRAQTSDILISQCITYEYQHSLAAVLIITVEITF